MFLSNRSAFVNNTNSMDFSLEFAKKKTQKTQL